MLIKRAIASFAVAIVLAAAVACGGGGGPVPVYSASSTAPVIFKKVDYFIQEGEDELDFDARMTLDPNTKMLMLADEDKGQAEATFAIIPYGQIKNVVYEYSKHRRWGAGLLLTPWALLTKGKKHWMTIEFEGVAELPQNFIYMRLDKNNFRQIIAAIEGGVGLEVERLADEG